MSMQGKRVAPDENSGTSSPKDFVRRYSVEHSFSLLGESDTEKICAKAAGDARELYKKERKEQETNLMAQVPESYSTDENFPGDPRRAVVIACTPPDKLSYSQRYVRRLIKNRKSSDAAYVYEKVYMYKMRSLLKKMETDVLNKRKLREEATKKLEDAQEALDRLHQWNDEEAASPDILCLHWPHPLMQQDCNPPENQQLLF